VYHTGMADLLPHDLRDLAHVFDALALDHTDRGHDESGEAYRAAAESIRSIPTSAGLRPRTRDAAIADVLARLGARLRDLLPAAG
jgi:hypothetical protein